MSPVTAPSRVTVGSATVFEDPDISFDNVQDQLFVVNQEKRPITWVYAQTAYELLPGKRRLIPFYVIKHYLGDPRSVQGKQGTHVDKNSANAGHRLGMVPERYAELRRLSIHYGAYEGLIGQLSTLKWRRLKPKDADEFWDQNLPAGVKLDDYVVPRMQVFTEDMVEIKFPVFEPEAKPYRYVALEVGENEDVRSELDRLKAENARTIARMEALERGMTPDEDDTTDAPEDSVGGLGI